MPANSRVAPEGEVEGPECHQDFDPERAMEDVRQLAIPRRVGTTGERVTVREVTRAFEVAGLSVRHESLRVPFAGREAAVRVHFAIAGLLGGLSWWVASSSPLISSLGWAVVAILLLAPWRVSPWWRSPLVLLPGFSCRNIIASLPYSGEREAPARVVFLAHHDSKSQVLPTGLRVALVATGLTLCLLLSIRGILAAIGMVPHANGFVARVLATMVLGALVAFFMNLTGNRSPGALDNATGLATLLELSRTWRPRPSDPIEPLWLATAAEETGLDGAIDFARRHEDWCRDCPTLIINLDSVGAGDTVLLVGTPSAVDLARGTADRLGIRHGCLKVIGAGMDHQPFEARGLTAITLLGDVVGRSLDLHSGRDTVDRVDRDSIARAGRLASELAWTWAARHVADLATSIHGDSSGSPVSLRGATEPSDCREFLTEDVA